MSETTTPMQTMPYGDHLPASLPLRRFVVQVIEPSGLAATWQSNGERCAIGSEASNDLVLAEKTVSRFHCEITVGGNGARIDELGSRNGTFVDGVRVERGWLRDGSTIRLGAVTLRFGYESEMTQMVLSDRTELGSMVGRSAAMRALFAILERAAKSDATVLLEGETGTGKGAAAEALHQTGTRADGPFIVIDCGAIPENLLESELFGHEKGAFTGATDKRIGAFEAANGGTLFLDEIGELPIDLQPKLLRVLESRTIKRVGANDYRPIDVRLIAATNRDLRADTNRGAFRADLYFRLAVVRATLPPLRERPDDIRVVAARLLDQLGATPEIRDGLLSQNLIAALQRVAWPGNVRELRNYLERCLVFEGEIPSTDHLVPPETWRIDPTKAYGGERDRALAQFEREYIAGLLRHHQGNVTKAAGAAGITRVHLYRLMNKHGISR